MKPDATEILLGVLILLILLSLVPVGMGWIG